MMDVLALYLRAELRAHGLGTCIATNLLAHGATGVNGDHVVNCQSRVTLPYCMQKSLGFWKRYGCDTSSSKFAIMRSFENVLNGHEIPKVRFSSPDICNPWP